MNWRDGESNPKFYSIPQFCYFFPAFRPQRCSADRALSVTFNTAYNRHASIGTVMHYILVISGPFRIVLQIYKSIHSASLPQSVLRYTLHCKQRSNKSRL